MVDYLFYEKSRRRRKKEKTDENSGHYVIASSRAPERRPLERRTLMPKSIILPLSKLNIESKKF